MARRISSLDDLSASEQAAMMRGGKGWKWPFRDCKGRFCSASRVASHTCDAGCRRHPGQSPITSPASAPRNTASASSSPRKGGAARPQSSSSTTPSASTLKRSPASTGSRAPSRASSTGSAAPTIRTRSSSAAAPASRPATTTRAESSRQRRARRDAQTRADWDGYEEAAYQHGESATRGNMQRRGADSPVSGIFWPRGRRPWHSASEELVGYWDGGGMVPVTLTEYKSGRRRPTGRPWSDPRDRRRR